MKKHFRITVNGKEFDVIAESVDTADAPVQSRPATVPIPAAVRSGAAAVSAPPAAAAAPATTAGAGDLPSPLSGKVVSIDAPAGTAVKTGDQVITLEAMKMNTVIAAHMDGTVKSIAVQVGDGVEEGQVLLTIA